MRTFRRETGLYLLAVCIGLAVRLIGLGAAPLSDLEASWALQALDISRGLRPALGSQPGYSVLTSALFFAFGAATNTLARLIPALTGSALILVPALFKEQLKPRPALVLAFTLAVEPGLAALSREAGSSILAVTFTLAAWGFWNRRDMKWAGACAGMALLSGPALWVGLLGLAIAWAILRPFERRVQSPAKPGARAVAALSRGQWITALSYALAAIVLLGTMFMTVPAGLSAWIASLPDYLTGWTRASSIPGAVLLFSLIAYQPLGVMLALLAVIRGWLQGSLSIRRLSLWMVVGLLLALFYPSRQVTDLAWMLIPLWALASVEVARNMNVRPGERGEVLGTVGISLLILVFMWLNLLTLERPTTTPDEGLLRTWLLLGSLFLLVVSVLLVGMGWSIRVARYGAVWGVAGFLGVYSLAALMSAAGHRNLPNGAEMWRPGAQLPMANLLLTTLQDYSAWSDADINAQPVTIAGIDSPALQWLLRDRPVEVRSAPSAASDAPMVITPEAQDPALVSAYRGQSLLWRSTPLWGQMVFPDWLPFHQISKDSEMVILWVRADLFPDTKPRPSP